MSENFFIKEVKAETKDNLSSILCYNFIKSLASNHNLITKKAEEFLGFTTDKNRESFELQKMYHILNMLSAEDLKVLKDLLPSGKKAIVAGSDSFSINTFVSLNSAGLLLLESGLDGALGYTLTNFGKKFRSFIVSVYNGDYDKTTS